VNAVVVVTDESDVFLFCSTRPIKISQRDVILWVCCEALKVTRITTVSVIVHIGLCEGKAVTEGKGETERDSSCVKQGVCN
jgi:hypothetical protein